MDSANDVADLPHLIRLIDDDDPQVRPVVKAKFEAYRGDISQNLAALGCEIPPESKKRLSHWLEPGRRQVLCQEWTVPDGGLAAWAHDWEAFENALRMLSDFLHDGITLRPSLPDQLDLLADEIRESFPEMVQITAEELRRWLFVSRRFSQPASQVDAVKHYDLCYVMDHKVGNATSLGVLYMLVAQRLGIHVDGCDYPGHFLTRIEDDGVDMLVDCYHGGRCFDVVELLANGLKLTRKAMDAILLPCGLGDVLLRYLREMRYSLSLVGRTEDAVVLEQLATMLEL